MGERDGWRGKEVERGEGASEGRSIGGMHGDSTGRDRRQRGRWKVGS